MRCGQYQKICDGEFGGLQDFSFELIAEVDDRFDFGILCKC